MLPNYDDTTTHTSSVAANTPSNCMLSHPYYSPDLTSYNFHMFRIWMIRLDSKRWRCHWGHNWVNLTVQWWGRVVLERFNITRTMCCTWWWRLCASTVTTDIFMSPSLRDWSTLEVLERHLDGVYVFSYASISWCTRAKPINCELTWTQSSFLHLHFKRLDRCWGRTGPQLRQNRL